MLGLLIALALIAYNNLINLWPPFGEGRLYVPINLSLAAGLLAIAVGPMDLTPAALGLGGSHGDSLMWGAFLGALVGLSLFAAAAWRRTRALVADQRLADARLAELGYRVLIRIPLGTALVEELAFRGVLLAAWSGLGTSAAVWSSVAFGLWHVTPSIKMLRANRPPRAQGSSALAAVVVTVGLTTGAGLLLAYLRVRTNGLAAPFAAHATVNGLSVLAAAFAHRARRSPRR